MNKLILCTALALLTAMTASVEAKDKKKKDKDKGRDDDRRERSGRYDSRYRDNDRYRGGDRYRHNDRYRTSDRSRTIYVIERERPVQRVVYIDSDGGYYQRLNGQRVYVRQRYYESYPSRYYTPSGQRRLSITLPF